MADKSRRIDSGQADQDRKSYVALTDIAGYKPANADYTLDKVAAAFQAMEAAQQAEVKAQAALDAARDNANAAEWTFHDLMLGAKDQVKAQYGPDSNELQSLGLKKKSERKPPTRRKSA